MIDGDLLDKLDFVAKRVRENQKPFGGLQVSLLISFSESVQH